MSSTIDPAVAAEVAAHPLARLTHFTPSRNLPRILRDGHLRSSADLDATVRAQYAKTDLERLDGHPELVCCSLQYPNGFYFDRARSALRVRNFPDWVCLLLDKSLAARGGTFFCPRNAAAGGGAHLIGGVAGLRACYAPTVIGQAGKRYRRGPRHDPGSPTDVQAEVLLPAPISLSHVSAIVVPTESAALQEVGRLERLGFDSNALSWVISPDMFNKWAVSAAVTNSAYVKESVWSPNSPRSA